MIDLCLKMKAEWAFRKQAADPPRPVILDIVERDTN